MKSYFTAEFFTANRERLRTLFAGTAPIVITANGLMQRNGDVEFVFRQDSSFWYLTGIDNPNFVLVMDKSKEYLIAPAVSDYQAIFEDGFEHQQLTERSGITEILPHKEGWKQLGGRLKKVTSIATLSAPPTYVEDYGMYTNPARAQLVAQIKEFNNTAELLDLRTHFAHMRVIKQKPELQAIRQAIDTTSAALRQVKRRLGKYSYEYEAEADILHRFVRAGFATAWPPVVAAGANATVIHHWSNNGPIAAKDLVILDIGAEVEHYAADISRTYAVSQPTKRQQQVWEAVASVQDYAYTLLKPGILVRENEQKIEQFMGEKLRELGLIKIIDHDSVRHYFPHATSHFLGLEVHDIGDYAKPLEPGMVLTVEPGIYIPEEGIGVRIEDDVLITKSGIEILTRRLPREAV
jgi:Xaa-Pro aminopeptidase